MAMRPLWLPIDAKFPNEDYERLVDASERGDGEAVETASKAVEMRIRASAKDICDKYVHPPHSTDFAVLFLPTEGLFAEIIQTARAGRRSSTGVPHRRHWPDHAHGIAK